MQANINFTNKAAPLKKIAALLYVIVASAFLPISLFGRDNVITSLLFSAASVILCILGLLLASALAGSFKPMIPFAMISLFLFFLSPSAKDAAILPILFSSIGIFAYIYSISPSYLLLLSAIPAYALSYFATDSLLFAFLSLVCIASGFVLFTVFKNKEQRVGSVLRLSITIGVIIILFLGVGLYESYGNKLSIELLRSIFDNFYLTVSEQISNALFATYEQLSPGLISLADAKAATNTVLRSIFNLLPAIFTILIFVISYISHSFFLALIVPVTEDKKIIANAVTFKMSIASAITFIAALVASYVLSAFELDMLAVAAQNIYFILFPGLTLIALGFILSFTRGKNASCLGFVINLAIFMMLLYLPEIIIPIAAFAGALIVIFSEIQAKKNK